MPAGSAAVTAAATAAFICPLFTAWPAAVASGTVSGDENVLFPATVWSPASNTTSAGSMSWKRVPS